MTPIEADARRRAGEKVDSATYECTANVDDATYKSIREPLLKAREAVQAAFSKSKEMDHKRFYQSISKMLKAAADEVDNLLEFE